MTTIKIALIEDGFISTVSLHPVGSPYPEGNWIPMDEAVSSGFLEKPRQDQVPDEIPLWAFRSAIALNGLTDRVISMIAALPEPQKTVAWQQWEYANWISRNHATVDQIANALGLTNPDVDKLFILGASLI